MKMFETVQQELSGRRILVANRGIPARRICRAIRERFDAIPVMTATDIDKAAPSASSAQEQAMTVVCGIGLTAAKYVLA